MGGAPETTSADKAIRPKVLPSGLVTFVLTYIDGSTTLAARGILLASFIEGV